MKRYKLKRELPKYSIGTEFILEDEALGGGYSFRKSHVKEVVEA